MTDGDVFRASAGLVRCSWWDGSWRNTTPINHCIVTAIYAVSGDVSDWEKMKSTSRFEKLMGIKSAQRWNDAPGQTQDNVVLALETAAILADEEDRAAAEAGKCEEVEIC